MFVSLVGNKTRLGVKDQYPFHTTMSPLWMLLEETVAYLFLDLISPSPVFYKEHLNSNYSLILSPGGKSADVNLVLDYIFLMQPGLAASCLKGLRLKTGKKFRI